jgi:peptide/nickel transport system substrate-binding protein
MKKALLRIMIALLLVGSIPIAFASAAPKPEGEIVIAIGAVGREVWTPLDGSMPEHYVMGIWNEKLLYRGVGKDQKLYGGLAESWEISADGLTYTFNIRKGVNFNEGWGPFTAEDVLYSLQMIGRKDSTSAGKHIVRDWIESMKVVSPYVLRIKLKEPHPDFTYWLSDFTPYLMMVSKKYFETVGEKKAASHPVGTGPWVLKEHVLGDHLTLEAVDNHWRKTPEFKKVTIKIVPEQGTAVAMLRAGSADLVNLSTAFLKEVEGAKFKVISNPGDTFYTVSFGGQCLPTREAYDPSVPWAQKDAKRALQVRKAMCLAINKKEIIDYLLKGKGTQVSVHIFSPGGPYTDAAWKPYPYDPKEAKRLLAEAGYANGFEKPIRMLLFSMQGRQELPDIGEAVAQSWEKIGLKVVRQPIDNSTWRDIYFSRAKEVRWSTYVLGSTPYVEPALWYNACALTAGRCHQLFESPEIDKLTSAATKETNLEVRIKKNLEIGQYVYDNYLASPIAMKDGLWGASPKIAGWSLNDLNAYLHNLEYIHRKK